MIGVPAMGWPLGQSVSATSSSLVVDLDLVSGIHHHGQDTVEEIQVCCPARRGERDLAVPTSKLERGHMPGVRDEELQLIVKLPSSLGIKPTKANVYLIGNL
jgi:hypothetical protein